MQYLTLIMPLPPPIPVAVPDMASSSQTIPPHQQDVSYAQILEALASIQGGMSSVQLTMSFMQ
jgi:hypothetical protein